MRNEVNRAGVALLLQGRTGLISEYDRALVPHENSP